MATVMAKTSGHTSSRPLPHPARHSPGGSEKEVADGVRGDDARRDEVRRDVEAFVGDLLAGARLPRQLRQEARDDFVDHLRSEIEAQRRLGWAPGMAFRRAVERFGSPRQIRRQLEIVADRRLRTWPALPSPRHKGDPLVISLWTDLRFAARLLLRSPGFAIVALLTVALGVGANTAIFTVIDKVLLRPLPYPEPERLVRVWPEKVFSEAMLQEVGEQSRSFAGLTAALPMSFTLIGEGAAETVDGNVVPSNYFSVLGVPPVLGRSFVDEDQQAGSETVALLSHGLWQRRFGGDPAVLGRSIRLGGIGYAERRIIGVLPADFRPFLGAPEVWVPMAVDPESPAFQRAYGWRALARLAPGATAERAAAEMRTLVPAFTERHPTQFRPRRVSPIDVVPLQESMVGGVRGVLLLLLGCVGLVLLIACSNVANLLLARGAARQPEIALRLALGASRNAILRQMLIESGLLSLLGGLLGLAASGACLHLMRGAIAAHLPRAVDAHLDWRLLAFTLGVSLVAGLLFGTLPALRAAYTPPRTTLAEGGKALVGGRKRPVRELLVAAEVALALVLVVAAGLLLKSVWRLQQVDAGFDPAHIVVLQLELPEGRYSESEHRAAFLRSVFERIEGLPGVEAAGAISRVPMTGGNAGIPYLAEGQPLPAGTPSLVGNVRIVTPGYFDAFGIRLLQGRMLSASDHADAESVVLINEAMAERHWPDGDATGKRILTTDGEPLATVAGVVADIRQHELGVAPRPEFYLYADQLDWQLSYLVARVGGDPGRFKATFREEVPIVRVHTMRELISASLGDPRFFTGLFSAFAGLALALGIIGVYGVMSYVMSQRARELGVRVALGASRRQVLAFAMRRAMQPIAIGVVAGAALAVVLTRWLRSFLFEVTAHDPAVFATVAATLAGAGAAASFLPALRATARDPVEVLRCE